MALTYGGAIIKEVVNGVALPVYTVATLPAAAANTGKIVAVSDALTPTYGGALTGGSTTYCLALSDGSAWKSH